MVYLSAYARFLLYLRALCERLTYTTTGSASLVPHLFGSRLTREEVGIDGILINSWKCGSGLYDNL